MPSITRFLDQDVAVALGSGEAVGRAKGVGIADRPAPETAGQGVPEQLASPRPVTCYATI